MHLCVTAAGDEGRGVGVVRTLGGLDREERGGEVLVPLVVGDAGRPPLSTTLTLTIVVADLNDNPMYPANKLVTAVILKVSPCFSLGLNVRKDTHTLVCDENPSCRMSSFLFVPSPSLCLIRHHSCC